jgi:hypothetical protein
VKDGCDPLSPDEFLLRRIPHNYVAPNEITDKIRLGHFEPQSGRDDDGISLYREKLVSAQQLVDSAKGKGPYYVARATVKEIEAIGLHPVITDEPSHTSVPELSVAAVKQNDDACRQLMLKLARLLSKQIVFGPASPRKQTGP